MIELNEQNFATETAQGVVVVDFYTKWCGPCKALSPVLETLTGAKVVKVDVEENMNLGVEFNVAHIPCIVFLKDGKEVNRMVGLQSQTTLQENIDKLNQG